MSEFKKYRRMSEAELRPYVPGESTAGVSISIPDVENGSPKLGDMIARNSKNHDDKWLVSAAYFKENFEEVGERAAIVFRNRGTGEAGPGGAFDVFLEGVRRFEPKDQANLPTAEFYAVAFFHHVIHMLRDSGAEPTVKLKGEA